MQSVAQSMLGLDFVHKVQSKHATVNVTVNQLASLAHVRWDLELDKTAAFKAECDKVVQNIMHLHCGVPTVDELQKGWLYTLIHTHTHTHVVIVTYVWLHNNRNLCGLLYRTVHTL